LIELSKHPSVQKKLREELLRLSGSDPTWDQMTNGLPYLDAVVHETLRLHPPLGATIRVVRVLCSLHQAEISTILIGAKAAENDVIPLSKPIETLSGITDHIVVAKGTAVVVPIHAMNKSAELWGEDAERFVPERWLDEAGLAGANDVQGYRHLLTFVDGTRKCLGQGFALAEFKVYAP
jgi:cytochrome P450